MVDRTRLGATVALSSGAFINSADYRHQESGVTVVGAGGPIGKTQRPANTVAPVVIVGRVGAAGAVHFYREPVFATDNTLIAMPDDTVRPRFLFSHFFEFGRLVGIAVRQYPALGNSASDQGIGLPATHA